MVFREEWTDHFAQMCGRHLWCYVGAYTKTAARSAAAAPTDTAHFESAGPGPAADGAGAGAVAEGAPAGPTGCTDGALACDGPGPANGA